MVLAAKRGQLKNPPAKIKKVASGISESSAADFAKRRQDLNKSMTGTSGY